ncbi:MAG TPA: DUF2652 domain-containing protein [Chryseolinea sp.]|nr:DUF2652 domain-containing protein [Chryseolinea sp.]
MNTTTQQGFLIIADITGFTPFVADTELEHSNEILHEMLKGILSYLTPTFTLAEVEGDAVFVYAPIEKFPRGETILEVIESFYTAFRDKKSSFHRVRTCGCKACQMAPSLDLKFIVHFGEYIMNNVSGKKKPLGASVNVAHRLLKNSISEITGWKAYMLLTKDCANAIGVDSNKFHQQTERYDHIGAVETLSVDLDALYRNALKDRKVYLSKEDADTVIDRDFPIPPTLLWDWLNDPRQRTRWTPGSDWNIGLRPRGRMGKGATNHCVNSKMMEKILDYRPFDYYTSSMGRGFFQIMLTSEFKEIPSGTRLSWHLKLNSILPKGISRFLCRLIIKKGMRVDKSFDILSELIQRDQLAKEVLVS